MTFLKKLGTILGKGLTVVLGLQPFINQFMPQDAAIAATVVSDLTQFQNIVVMTESFGATLGTPGPDKLKAAVPAFAQILMASQTLAGKKIADPAMFELAASEYAQATVDLLNSLHQDGVQTASKTA